MEFEERKQRAVALLREKGLWRSTYAPPLTRLLWRLGVKMRPLPFCTFWHIVLILGSYFGITWGVAMWLALWRGNHTPPVVAIVGSLIAGVLFGMAMALVMTFKRRRYRLPRWEEL